MNIINVKVNFTRGTCETTGINLITGDYNSTKMVFQFDREDGTKIFEMKSPSEQLVMVQEIENNEIVLYGLDDNEQIASIFTEDGSYIFEISLYENGSKLTSASGKLKVKPEQVIIDDEVVEAYLPVFDQLMAEINEAITETNNLDLDMDNTLGVVTATITKKDGTTKEVEVIDTTDYYTKTEVDSIKTTIEGEIPTKVSQLTNDSAFINKEVNNLTNYTLGSATASTADLTMDSSYVITLTLKNNAGTTLVTKSVDLPLETMVVDGYYDSVNKKLVLELDNGTEIEIPVGDLISGLQTEITNSNKLSSDLVDDTGHTNKFVTASDKTTWSAKYDKPSGGIPKTDLSSAVQTSLGKADTALQSHQDITGKEDKSNKVTSISGSSTDTQYPSAKCVYDSQVAQDELITELEQETDLILDQIPKGTVTGQDITLNDSSNLPIKSIEISGNTSQKTLTGKNLLNIEENATFTTMKQIDISLQAGTYYVYRTSVSGGGENGIYLRASENSTNMDLSNGTFPKTLTLASNETKIYLYSNGVNYSASTGISATINQLMITTTSTTDYEPYCGGIPAPNPDFPMEVKVVKGDNVITECGKNLFKVTNTSTLNVKGYNINSNGEQFKINGTYDGTGANSLAISLYGNITNANYPNYNTPSTWFKLPAGEYTLTNKTISGTYNNVEIKFRIYEKTASQPYTLITETTTNGTTTFTLNEEKEISINVFLYSLTTASVFNNYIFGIMIAKGNENDYEPYTGTDYPLNLGVKNLWSLGNITSNGTYSSSTSILLGELDFKVGTYTISLTNELINSSYLYIGAGGSIATNITKEKTFTISEAGTYSIRYIRGIGTYNNFETKVQLEEGSIAHSYSPYGQEPIELCKINTYKDIFVKPSGSNLFDGELELGIINGTTGANSPNNSYIRSKNYIPVEELTDYKFSTDSSSISTILVYEYKEDFTYNLSTNKSVVLNSAYLTTNAGTKYIRFRPYNETTDTTIKFMVNKGTTALPYEPYNNNKWYKKASIGKVVLDGSETWNGYTTLDTETTTWFQMTALDNALAVLSITNSYLYSDNFTIFNCYNPSPNQGLCYHSDRKIQIRLLTSYLSDTSSLAKRIESFKTWLSTHNTEVYYVLATPKYTLCNDTLQTQLDAIWNMKTNKNVTNISITSDDLKPYLDIVYRKDLETLFSNL